MIKYENMSWYDYKLMRNVNSLIDKVPVMLRLYPTTQCNSHCYYCSNVSPEPALLDVDLACKAIRMFAEAGGKSVQISGGEPTLYEGWEDIILLIRQNKLDWAFFTNGVLLEKALNNQFVKAHPPKWLRVSLDAGSDGLEIRRSRRRLLTPTFRLASSHVPGFLVIPPAVGWSGDHRIPTPSRKRHG